MDYTTNEREGIMGFELKGLFDELTAVMKRYHEDNHDRFLKLEDKLNTVITETAIIKGITADVKKDIYGNGNIGMKVRLSQTEDKICNMENTLETAKEDIIANNAQTTKLDFKIGKFVGIVVGVNLMLTVLFALLINWDKVKGILPHG